jgi:hypothetical protein
VQCHEVARPSGPMHTQPMLATQEPTSASVPMYTQPLFEMQECRMGCSVYEIARTTITRMNWRCVSYSVESRPTTG